MFSPESFLGYFKNKIHGTRGLNTQFVKSIITKGTFVRDYQIYLDSFVSNVFVRSLLEKWFETETYDETFCSPLMLRNVNHLERLFFNIKLETTKIQTYSRYFKKKTLYQSRSYIKASNVNSFTVKFFLNTKISFGLIEYFIFFDDANYACITLLDLVEESFLFNLKGNTSQAIKTINKKKLFDSIFSTVYLTNKMCIINCESIICKCVLVDVRKQDDFFYISDFITETEHG